MGIGATTTVDVKANDFFSPNATLEYLPVCGSHSGLTVTPPSGSGSVFSVQANALGVYTFCYALRDCNGLRCDVGKVKVVVWNENLVAQACGSLPECELVPFGSFEEFNDQETMLKVLAAGAQEGKRNTGFSFGPVNVFDNTADFFQNTALIRLKCFGPPTGSDIVPIIEGDKASGLIARNGASNIDPTNPALFVQEPEGFAFPLCRPVYPGMRGEVTFLATNKSSCQNNHIRVEYSSRPPLWGRYLYQNPGANGPRNDVLITSNELTTPIWRRYTVPFHNNSDSCWNYMYLSSFKSTSNEVDGFGYILIDDVHLTLQNHFTEIFNIAPPVPSRSTPCPGELFTVDLTLCKPSACTQGGSYENPDINIETLLPPGLSFVPSADFPTPNIVIPRGSMGNCKTLRLNVQVDNNTALVGQELSVQFRLGANCFDVHTISTLIKPAGVQASLLLSMQENSGIPNDGIVCKGAAVIITATTNGSFYLWSTGATTQSITVSPTATQSYTVTVTGLGLCPNSDFVSVVVEDCTFTCPCTDAETLNIDATTEHRYSVLEALYDYDKNNDGNLTDGDHNGCIAIAGRLEIDVELGINAAEIRMQPCSEIVIVGNSKTKAGVVIPGKKFVLTGNDIHGCDVMWKGIRAEEGASLTLLNNQLIADAENAAWVVPSASGNAFSSLTRADIRNNNFQRNYTGIYVAPPSSGNISFGGQVIHTITGNSFDGASLLPRCSNSGTPNVLSPVGYAGVVVNGADITVGSAAGSPFSNYFSHMGFGVVARSGSKVTVLKNFFSDITGAVSGTAPTAGAGIFSTGVSMDAQFNRFSACTYGIYSGGGVDVTIRDNTVGSPVDIFADLQDPVNLDIYQNWDLKFKEYGIRARGLRNVTASVAGVPVSFNRYDIGLNTFFSAGQHNGTTPHCAVLLSNAGGAPDMPTGSRFYLNTAFIADRINGFVVENQNRWQITDNYVQMEIPPAQGNSRKLGIGLFGAHNNYLYGCSVVANEDGGRTSDAFSTNQSQNNKFCCNYMYGTNRGAFFAGSCTGTQYRFNQMSSHANPVYMNPSGTTGPQGSQTETFSNIFEPGCGIAKHEGGQFIAQNSQFFVTDMNPPNWPDGVDPDIFFKTNFKPSIPCSASPNNCPPPDYGDIAVAATSDPVTAQGSFVGSAYGDALQWENERDLYQRLKLNPALLGESAAIAAFFANIEAGSALKAHYEADQLVRETDILPAPWSQALQSAVDSIRHIETAANNLLNGLSAVSTHADSLMLYEQASAVHMQATPFMQMLSALQQQTDSLRQIKAQTALPQILALPEGDVLQSKRKTVHRVYLEWRASGSDTLTAAQFAAIGPIAHQCASMGGTAVYLARALYQIKEAEGFDDGYLCDQAEDRTSLDKRQPSKTFLWPNPANNQINIWMQDIQADQSIDVQIRDISGQILRSFSTFSSNGIIQIEVEGLSSGMYFCHIHPTDRKVETLKFVISK
jgi:hypothetical protein